MEKYREDWKQWSFLHKRSLQKKTEGFQSFVLRFRDESSQFKEKRKQFNFMRNKFRLCRFREAKRYFWKI